MRLLAQDQLDTKGTPMSGTATLRGEVRAEGQDEPDVRRRHAKRHSAQRVGHHGDDEQHG
jgi:hypothetical protein